MRTMLRTTNLSKGGAKVGIKKKSPNFRDSYGNDGNTLGILGTKWE